MPRPKSYNRQEAIERACYAFWEHGYQALGVRELQQLTGLNQFAIQTEFGGKEALYLEAVKFYSDAAISHAMKPMENGGLAEIIMFLKKLVDINSMTSSPWGCLVVNTGIENARIGSDKLDQAARYYWDKLEEHFLRSLQNAKARDEIRDDIDLQSTSKALVAAVMGVHAKNRTVQSNDGGGDLVEFMCSNLTELRKS